MLDLVAKLDSEPHDSARDHLTGNSEYVDDRPFQPRELLVGVVYSPHAHARLLSIDTRRAQAIPGVCCVLTATDLACNLWGSIIADQPFLARNVVRYVGEVIAVIGAEDKQSLRQAQQAMRIRYEPLPAVLELDVAIASGLTIGEPRQIKRGACDQAMQAAEHRLSGTLRIAGADHFYLENQATIVYPLEHGAFAVHSSTQHPSETQHLVAAALGIPQHRVVCEVKRLGGGFGGKETQAAPFAVYAALVAKQTGRPARLVLSKDEDMLLTGKRNPYRVDYKVGFSGEGRIQALKVQLYGNGGAYADLSPAILERAMAHVDNAYYLEHVSIQGQVYQTHVHPHTAFRGFGAPKGIATIEEIIDRIAAHIGQDPLQVRLQNVYQGDHRCVTPYGQTVDNNLLPELLNSLSQRCDYYQRRQQIEQTAEPEQPWLRGIALTPVKFGIAFNTRFLNQGSALVVIHLDGTVQVTTGAVEMGQGVNARIARLVADELGLGPDSVRLMPTSTDKNANTSATAASSGTDINGAAALHACRQIKARLGSLCEQLESIPRDQWAQQIGALGLCEDLRVEADFDPERLVLKDGKASLKDRAGFVISFQELVKEAYFNRIALSAYGFHRTEGLSFNKISGQGRAFQYFTQGAACTELRVHRDTGAVKVDKVDILMDAGRPINYGLDYGQVAGAFVQGMGWLTTEALYYDDQGKLLSHGPSTYKIPSIHETPRHFQIDFVKNLANTGNVGRSKALGEPPLLLSISVWAAIRDAINAPVAKRSVADFRLIGIPAGPEQILRQLYPEQFASWEADGDEL